MRREWVTHKGERWERGGILRNGEFTGIGETKATDSEVVIIC